MSTRAEPRWMAAESGVLPGIGEPARRWHRGEVFPRPATTLARPLTGALHDGGSAWGDSAFVNEILRANLGAGAGRATEKSIMDLSAGAPLVISGQQPGLLGGPLYCLWKIWGAISLARALSTVSSGPVVPVYWCGADDSDFEEVRRVWIIDEHGAPLRGELSSDLHEPRRQVGQLPGEPIAHLERSLLQRLRPGPGREWLQSILDSIPGDLDFGQRMGAWLHGLLPESGLVVVDARSPRLIQMGRPLFEHYARCREQAEALVADRSQQMRREGWEPPLAEAAVSSGLFRVEDGRRRKLAVAELSEPLDAAGEISASVLLRPLWQDQLLGPSIAVLGPAEQGYHVQIAPLYELLGVRAAAPAPRPHAVLVPSALRWPKSASEQRKLLLGGEEAFEVLRAMALPRSASESLARFSGEQARAVDRLHRQLELPERDPVLKAMRERLIAGVHTLSEELARRVLERPEGRSWRRAAAALRFGSLPQERALASASLWSWRDEDSRERLDELGAEYFDALRQRRPLEWVLHGGRP